MIRFFRNHFNSKSDSGSGKLYFIGAIILMIVGSFLLQIAMGICPVP